MKKRITTLFAIIIISLLMIIFNTTNAQATSSDNEFFELQFKIINNEENENVDIYLLLPKEYIEFAIEHDKLDIEYEGASTLKENKIPSIDVDRSNILDDIYEEDGTEYIQILLEKNEDNIYSFNILSDYFDLDMKYRIKNDDKDFIAHIDNFDIENGVCEIEYDYNADIVKQPDRKMFSFGTILLVAILIIILILGISSYTKHKNNI